MSVLSSIEKKNADIKDKRNRIEVPDGVSGNWEVSEQI